MSNTGKTYFGLASLIVAIVSAGFLAGSYAITMIDISARTFARLNSAIYVVYCIATPLAVALGAWSFRKKNDLRVLSVLAFGLTVLPFLVLFWQFVVALIRYN
jgi:ABC-type tungstate transport system substrate-binding protein